MGRYAKSIGIIKNSSEWLMWERLFKKSFEKKEDINIIQKGIVKSILSFEKKKERMLIL